MSLLPSRRPSAANALVTQTIRNFPSETAEVIGRHDARIERTTVLLLAVMVIVAIVLAGVTNLDRVVTSTGRMVSVEGTLVVQPLEVAIIRGIKVQQGEVVHKGQSLATLDPTFTNADVGDLQHQVASLGRIAAGLFVQGAAERRLEQGELVILGRAGGSQRLFGLFTRHRHSLTSHA